MWRDGKRHIILLSKKIRRLRPMRPFLRGDLLAYLRQLKESIRLLSTLSSNNPILEEQIIFQMRQIYGEKNVLGWPIQISNVHFKVNTLKVNIYNFKVITYNLNVITFYTLKIKIITYNINVTTYNIRVIY